jgi:hypothetical protein
MLDFGLLVQPSLPCSSITFMIALLKEALSKTLSLFKQFMKLLNISLLQLVL